LVGKLDVSFAGSEELGVELDGVTDIGDDDKRRPALGGGKGAGVAFGLVVGGAHGGIIAGGAALAMAGFEFGGWGGESNGGGGRLRGAGFDTLLGFHDEMTALIAIDIVAGGGAIGTGMGNDAVKGVGVEVVVGGGGFGAGHAEEIAEFGNEKLVVGALGAAGFAPAGDKGFGADGGGERRLGVGVWC